MVEVKLKGLPNQDVVQGFPGIPATWPRIQGTIEIRPNAKDIVKDTTKPSPLNVLKVTIGLYRTDSFTPASSKPSITSTKREQSFLVTARKEIWHNSAEIYALDLPFTLSLPTNRTIAASLSLGKVAETLYYLFVSIEFKDVVKNVARIEHRRFPIGVRRFDTLSTFSMFHKPIVREVQSPDHFVTLEYSLPVSAYGAKDVMLARLKVSANQDWSKARKARLKRVSLELVQITKYVPLAPQAAPGSGTSSGGGAGGNAARPGTGSLHSDSAPPQFSEKPAVFVNSGDAPPRRQRVVKVSKELDEIRLDDGPSIQELALEIPGPKLDTRDNLMPKEAPGVTNEGRVAFTTSSSLYKIEFVLVFKARFSHAKDIESEHPVTISQFDHAAGMAYMRAIMEAAELARFADKSTPPATAQTQPLDKRVTIR